METGQRRRALLRCLAWVGVALVLAITTLSAFIRLSRAGAGCEPWPQCHSARRDLPLAQLAPLDSQAISAARTAHRIAASAALLLFLGLLVPLHRRPVAPKASARLALATVAAALFLAVLGSIAGPSRATGVVMGNLLAGFAMLALAVRLAISLRDPGARALPAAHRAAATIALVFVAVQAALGAALSAADGEGRCGESLLCNAHRATGIVTLVAVAACSLSAWGTRGVAPRLLLVLAVAQGALGLALVRWGSMALSAALAHNVAAALLAATVAAMFPGRAR